MADDREVAQSSAISHLPSAISHPPSAIRHHHPNT
jgi:hypothetical protein